MKLRMKAWREYVKNCWKSNYRKFAMIHNKVNKMIRSDKESYNRWILDSFKGDPKKIYGRMRSLKTVKAQVIQLTKKDGSLTTDDFCKLLRYSVIILQSYSLKK